MAWRIEFARSAEKELSKLDATVVRRSTIQDELVTVLIVKVGHRREVYRQK